MNRKNILIVDRDKEFMLELREAFLPYNSSYQTAFTNSTAKAREILERFMVHLVLVNVQLAGESGIDLLLHVRRHYADTYVVLYSSNLTEELKRSAYHGGAAAVMEHPFRIEDLLRVLTDIFFKDSGSSFLDSVHLADLLQLIGMGRHSTDVVVVGSGQQRGVIRIRKGNLVEAEACGKRDVEAVTEMLSWRSPAIRTCRASTGIGIAAAQAVPLHDVLMKAVAKLDERNGLSPLTT
jgi:CheY-like chemotaxis protein